MTRVKNKKNPFIFYNLFMHRERAGENITRKINISKVTRVKIEKSRKENQCFENDAQKELRRFK